METMNIQIVSEQAQAGFCSDYALENIETSSSVQQLGIQSVKEFLISLPSENSRKSMYRYTKIVAQTLGFNNIESFNFSLFKENIIRGLLSVMGQKYAPATVRTCLSVIRGIAYRLKVNKVITDQEYDLIKNIKHTKGSRLGSGRSLSEKEINQIFSSIDSEKTIKAKRDAAIIAVLVMCGLRRAECAFLSMDNLHLDEEEPYLQIVGKGNKERICFLPTKALNRLNEWLDARGDDDGYVFLPIRKNDEIAYTGITQQAIYNIVKERGEKSHVLNWSTHDLRRTYATRLLELNIDLSTVKDMMGHSNIQTTTRYDKRGLSKMKNAVSILNGL